MINKVTNTQCRSKFLFFLLTLYKSWNSFLSGTSTAIFTLQILFSTVFGEEDEKGRLGRALSARWTPCFAFLCQDARFFPREVRCQYFGWNRHLMSPGQELTSKSSPLSGKIQDESYPWPARFCSLWWVPPGNLPVTDFVSDKSYPLKVSK